jgi:hypothetical protein
MVARESLGIHPINPGVYDSARGYTHLMDVRPWPHLNDEDRWLADAMEQRLRDNTQSAEQLRTRARELRAEAERSDVKGIGDAALALAQRYEHAATARLSA